jgi:uncharacterized protein (TIGR03083 family)
MDSPAPEPTSAGAPGTVPPPRPRRWYLDALTEQADRLGGAVDSADRDGLDAPVASCPGWSVRDVVAHLGRVHRWATVIVAEGRLQRPERDDAAATLPDSCRSPGGLADWYREGASGLLTALEAAPDGLTAWVVGGSPMAPAWFWPRRQLHETAVHHADVLAGLTGTWCPATALALDPEIAADGVDELLATFVGGPRSAFRASGAGVLVLQPTDVATSWTIRSTPQERPAVERHDAAPPPTDDSTPTATLRAPAAELLLFAWNRAPLPGDDPATTGTLTGDADVLRRWRADVRIG